MASLAVTLPTLSCGIGTPERKIIDACAEAISAAYIDQYLVGSLLDIDTKAGIELEQFVGIFGYGRLQGTSSTGTVVVTLTVASNIDFTIQQGAQFYTPTGISGTTTQLYFSSTSTVVLPAGDMTVSVPVQCTTVGSVGNLPPGSITSMAATIGSASVTNLQALIGGTDVETDAELRQRFKDTFLRNVAGTADYYIALCQQNNNVTRCVAYGPIALYTTQIAAPATTLTLPVTQDVKYVWPGESSCFFDLGQADEVFYSDVDDYTLSSGASPVFTRISTGAIVAGTILDLEFQYTTASSRNNPSAGITNKVDIFCDGVAPYAVAETTVLTATALSSSSADPLYTGNFVRVGSAGSPTAGNRFTRLGNVPIVNFPTTVTVGSTVYVMGTHYFQLQDVTLLQGSRLESSGIEWAAAGPANGTQLVLHYVYNQVPEVLDAVMGTSKQLTTDVLVHQAEYTYLQPCLNIEYDRSYSVSVVNAAIASRLTSWIGALPFGAQVKLSSLTTVVTQVLGVIDCKITTSTDNPSRYGVQMFANSSDPTPATVQTTDFKLDDSMVAYFLDAKITRIATP
jgi:uncharacterized phage protein gp47/JayE